MHNGIAREFWRVLLLASAVSCGRDVSQLQSKDSGGIGPKVAVIADTVPSCGPCSIELSPPLQLGGPRDPVLVEGLPVVQHAPGRYYVAALSREFHPILVYDEEGRYQRTVGGEGGGPGEYTWLSSFAVMSDGGLAIGHSRNRISIFDSAGRYVRSLEPQVGWVQGLTPLSDGRFVVVTASYVDSTSGSPPVHLVDATGRRVRALGSPNLLPWEPSLAMRFAAASTGGRLWIGERVNYRVEQVDTLGRLGDVIGVWQQNIPPLMDPIDPAKMVIGRVPPPGGSPRRPARLQHEPQRWIEGVHVEADGLMWSVSRVAVDNWRDVEVHYDARFEGESAQTPETAIRMYQTVIDAIDVNRGVLLARRVLPFYGGLTDDGRLVQTSYSDEGYIVIRISRLSLVGRQQP